jgi:WD40 repeat protein
MQPTHSVFSLFRWFTGSLLVLCVLGNGLSVWLGGKLSTQLISLTRADAREQADQLHLMDIRSGLTVKVSDQAVACCTLWSPNGMRIAFAGANGEVFIWNLEGGQTQMLPLPDKAVSIDDWSNDGQSLLVTILRGDVGYQ